MYSPYIVSKYMFLDLPRDVICSVAHFKLCARALQVETVTFAHDTSPTCNLCNTLSVQDGPAWQY